MFAATVVNFLLSSLETGTEVALFIVLIRKALVVDINYPLVERADLIGNALQSVSIIGLWAGYLPVSIIELSLPDTTSIRA